MDDLTNRVIKGYELKECVAAGGFGQIYRAHQSSVGREVAVKVILPQHANRPDFIRRFEVEAKLIAHLEHPHIVPLYDYWRDPEGAFLVMRWLKESLRGTMQRGPWSAEAASRLLDEIAGGLTVAHREGVIHRDIKPDNILLDEDENAYLADFGIAKDLNVEGHTEEGALVGSLAYITPEQISGETVTPRSDIYTLGLVMYEILVSEKPFPMATTPAEWINVHLNEPLPHLNLQRPYLPAALNEVLHTATAKDPAQRYPNALRFAAAFRAALPAQQRGAPQPLPEALTERELDILRLIIDGLSNLEIAHKLFLTVGTVKWYVNQIYSKLDVHSRHQAIERAQQLNLMGEASSLNIISGNVPPKHEQSRVLPINVPRTDFFNPYKGLRAFQETDSRDFYGRAALTEQLLSRLSEQGNASQFLAVVGPSGSGKSSVVKAGLIPALRQGALPNSASWFITEMLPGTHPLEELEAALMRVAVTAVPDLINQLSEDRRGLVRAAKRVLPADQNVELILVIDQFEELFTMGENENIRAHFIDNILSAVTDPRSRVRVILTLRADFYDRPLLYPRLAELVRSHTEVVVPMTSPELERAIAGPAERIGLQFEPGLIATIINDVDQQPGTLPLLQFALTELFERREGVILTQDAYKNSGGISGSLVRRADELYNDLDSDGHQAARQLFLRLITLGEGTEDTRRRALQTELSLPGSERTLDEVIGAFVQYRLLTLDHDPVTRGPTVEIAHEALIREWGRLRAWLAESREDLRVHRRLMAAAGEWENSKYELSFLASGARLAQFETLRSDSNLVLNAIEKAYLEASAKAREQQSAEELKRKAREKSLEQRSRNFLRALVGIFLLSTVIALVLASIALYQRSIAQHNVELSQSLALASAAQSALTGGNVDQALALSVAGSHTEQSPIFAQRILYDVATAPATIRRFSCTSQWCWAMDVSPDEQTILTTDASNQIILSDIRTGQPIRIFKGGHTDAVQWVKFLPDGKRFVSTSIDDQIILWDIASGQIIHKYTSTTGDTNGVDISPDGRLAAVATERGVPFLWDLESGQLVRQFFGHDLDKQVQGVAFSPDGRTLLTGSEDTTMIQWDVTTGQLLHRFQGHTNVVFKVRFSPDGKFALSTSFDNTMILWNIASGQIVQRFVGHTNWIFDARFTPDGKYIVSASRDHTLGLWDVASGILLRSFKGEAGMALSVKLVANGTQAISSYNDSVIRIWQLGDRGILRKFQQFAPPAPDQFNDTLNSDGNVLAMTNDGRRAVTAGAGAEANQIWLWDVETGQLLRRFVGHKANITSVVFSSDQRQLLSASGDHSLILWDTETGNQLRRYDGHTGAVLDATFSPDGKTIVSSSEDRSIIVWSTDTASIVHRFEAFTDSVNAVQFSSDGRTLIAGFGTIRSVAGDDTDNSLRQFDMGTMKETQRYTGHTGPVTTIAVGPNNTILSGSTDGTARLWDIASGRELRRFSGHSTPIWSINFSHNGQYVVAGAQDGSIIVWNLATGDIVRQFNEHDAMVYGVMFASDDDNLLSAAADGTMHLRRLALDTKDLLAWTQANHYIPELTCEQRALYNLTPACDASETFPTSTPFPTTTGIAPTAAS